MLLSIAELLSFLVANFQLYGLSITFSRIHPHDREMTNIMSVTAEMFRRDQRSPSRVSIAFSDFAFIW